MSDAHWTIIIIAVSATLDAGGTVVQCTNEVHALGDVLVGEYHRRLIRQWRINTEFAIELVPADFSQVVTALGEVEVSEQVLRGVNRNWFTRAKLAVDVLECFRLVGNAIFFQGVTHGVIVAEFFANASFGLAQR